MKLLSLLLLASVAGSCRTVSEKSAVHAMVNTDGFLELWSTRDIKVCIPDTTTITEERLNKVRVKITEEFEKVGFDFSRGWKKCTSEDETAALVKLSFALNKPAPFGGSAPVGSIAGRLSEVEIRADFETHSDAFCRSNPETCLLGAVVHEFGHVTGLRHSHMHPLARIAGKLIYPLPMHIANNDEGAHAFNYLGDYDAGSIMNYINIGSPEGRKQTTLSKGDKAAILALYEQPTVLLSGSSAKAQGRLLTKVDLRVAAIARPIDSSYNVAEATHYRYKIVEASGDCKLLKGYSTPIDISTKISDNLSGFKTGTDIKICVLGVQGPMTQAPESASNLFWQVGVDHNKSHNFEGTVFTEGCSGSLLRFKNSLPSDKAYVLTNGHCAELQNNEIVRNKTLPYPASFYVLSPDGTASQDREVTSSKLVYASFTKTDLALYQLDSSYDDIRQQFGVTPLTLATEAARVNTDIEILSGFYSEGFSCKVEVIAKGLIEGSLNFENAMRYSKECLLFHGTSGSPVLDRKSREIVGINSTGSDEGLECWPNNPCEVDEQGRRSFAKGRGYATQVSDINSCLKDGRIFDASLATCLLPRKK